MGNHYRLLVETPDANLAKGMHQLRRARVGREAIGVPPSAGSRRAGPPRRHGRGELATAAGGEMADRPMRPPPDDFGSRSSGAAHLCNGAAAIRTAVCCGSMARIPKSLPESSPLHEARVGLRQRALPASSGAARHPGAALCWNRPKQSGNRALSFDDDDLADPEILPVDQRRRGYPHQGCSSQVPAAVHLAARLRSGGSET